jgi:hypothetical protein
MRSRYLTKIEKKFNQHFIFPFLLLLYYLKPYLIRSHKKNFWPNEDELTKFYTIKSTTIQDPKNHEY